jgi:hypothetical protein
MLNTTFRVAILSSEISSNSIFFIIMSTALRLGKVIVNIKGNNTMIPTITVAVPINTNLRLLKNNILSN